MEGEGEGRDQGRSPRRIRDCGFGRLLRQVGGAPFAGSTTQRLRLGLLGPPAIPWSKGCFGSIRGFLEGLVHMFPVPSTSLLHHQNCTPSTSRGAGFSPPTQPLCNYQSPQHYTQPGVNSGSGSQGAAGMWAANPREGGTKVPEVQDWRPLTRWNPPRRDFVPVPGERSPGLEGSGAGQGRSAHLPGSPEVPRLQRDPRRVFSILFLPVGGRVSEAASKPPHLTAPRPALRSYKRALSECRHQINTQEAIALSTPRCALYASLSVTSLFPLASRIFFPSSISRSFFKIRERCGRRTLAAARFLLSNVPL